MTGIELDMVVTDSLGALALYEKIFDGIERVEVTSLEKGVNEAVFTLYGMRIHMLDENAEYGLTAPKPGNPKSVWLNVLVPDINKTYKNAIDAGCAEIQPVTEITTHGVKNAIFSDKYGYVWMLHELVRVVSFEERMQAFERMANEEN